MVRRSMGRDGRTELAPTYELGADVGERLGDRLLTFTSPPSMPPGAPRLQGDQPVVKAFATLAERVLEL